MSVFMNTEPYAGLVKGNRKLAWRLRQWPRHHTEDLTTYLPSVRDLIMKVFYYVHELTAFTERVNDPAVNDFMDMFKGNLENLCRCVSQTVTALACFYQRIHGRRTVPWPVLEYLWPNCSRTMDKSCVNQIYMNIQYRDDMDALQLTDFVDVIKQCAATESLLRQVSEECLFLQDHFRETNEVLQDAGYDDQWRDADDEESSSDDEFRDGDAL